MGEGEQENEGRLRKRAAVVRSEGWRDGRLGREGGTDWDSLRRRGVMICRRFEVEATSFFFTILMILRADGGEEMKRKVTSDVLQRRSLF